MYYSVTAELTYLGPESQPRSFTLAEARRYCCRLACSHYENFSVASLLLPRRLLTHFHAVYAYCRWADDLADEAGGGTRALQLLAWWREELLRCYDGRPRHPVMRALQPTIQRFGIPPQPFLDLLVAFEQDQRVTRYASYEQLLGYCRNSANPVGRLVLYLCECHEAGRALLADRICTGLQLANFWQDVTRDLDIGRIYIPAEDLERFGCSEADLEARRCSPAFVKLMRFEVERARELFLGGWPLVAQMPADVQADVDLFVRGGLAILRKIEACGFDVLARRPVLSKWDKAALLGGALYRRLRTWLYGRRWIFSPRPRFGGEGLGVRGRDLRPLTPNPSPPKRPKRGRGEEEIDRRHYMTSLLSHSYTYCERLARREAKHFYPAFRLLPRPQRLAMCALYAFMRIADDLSDGPGTPAEKRGPLEDWRRRFDRALEGQFTHPLHPALAHTIAAYAIPPEYLHAVLDGVCMDLEPVRYNTFAELYSYCYHVASAVGLACIHVWGFSHDEAKGPAEAAGIAFQMTNILRDLAEDASRGRVYLPGEDLEALRLHSRATGPWGMQRPFSSVDGV